MPRIRSWRDERAARAATPAVPRAQPPMVIARNGPTFHGKSVDAQLGSTKASAPKIAIAAAAAHSSHLRHVSSTPNTSTWTRPRAEPTCRRRTSPAQPMAAMRTGLHGPGTGTGWSRAIRRAWNQNGGAGRAAVKLPRGSECQWLQPPGLPADSAVRKLLPQPQPDTALGLLTVNPAPISVSR